MKISPDAPRKQIKRPKKTFAVDEECVSKKRTNIELSSSIFGEREFCVITGHETLSKSELETRIIQNGGLIVQHPGYIIFIRILLVFRQSFGSFAYSFLLFQVQIRFVLLPRLRIIFARKM